MYYNGDNGVGPLVSLPPGFGGLIIGFSHLSEQSYSLILFQSLAFTAGYDPVAGPGSPCSAGDASGKCVVSWVGGTKSVSSVVLVATGISFAV